jgi:hypothetical protein
MGKWTKRNIACLEVDARDRRYANGIFDVVSAPYFEMCNADRFRKFLLQL